MKGFIFSLLTVVMFSCSNQRLAGPGGPDLQKWQISDDVANSMREYLNNCSSPCYDGLNIKNPNDPVQDLIRQTFGQNGIPVEARYRPEDEARYAEKRGLRDPSHYAVSGYKTELYEATLDGITYYYDIVSICPPPPQCDDSTKAQDQ